MAGYEWHHDAGFPGVRFRKHPTRKHGVKFDQYFAIRYQKDGKRHEAGLGWSTEGWTAEKAFLELSKLKAAAKTGEGPATMPDKRKAKALADMERRAREQAEAKRNITVEEFFADKYLPKAKADKKRDTWRFEESLFDYWIKPVIGDLTIAEIGVEHLEKIKANMLAGKRDAAKMSPKSKQVKEARPMSARSINGALAVIRQIWNYAADMKPPLVTGQWPGAARSFKKPKINNARCRFLTQDEAARLLASLKATAEKAVQWPRRKEQKPDYTSHDIALLALHTGMRFGEISGLTWDRVHLTKQLAQLLDTKTGDPRTVFLTEPVIEMLRRRSLDTKGCRYVFPGSKKVDGEFAPIPFPPSTIKRAIDALGFNAGVTDPRQRISFHSLRHTFASWLVEQGESIRLVGDLLGHKTLTMTVRYSHVSADAQKAAVAALGKRLSPERGANVVDLEAAKQKASNQDPQP